MNVNLPRLPQSTASLGPPLRGSDVLLAVAIGASLFWLGLSLVRELAAGSTSPGARINYMLGFFAAWVFAWLAAIWLVFVRRRGMSFADLGYVVPSPVWAARGVLCGFGALPAAFALHMVLSDLLAAQERADLRELFGGDSFTGIHAAALLLYAGFLVPIVEELLFRGLLFRWLRQRLDFWPAAVISSALFGLAHQRIDQMIIVGLLGLPLAWLYERSKTLVPAILMHQTYNSLMLMVTFALVWFQPAV